MHVRSATCMSAFQSTSQAFSGSFQHVLFLQHVDRLTCQGNTGDASTVGLGGLVTELRTCTSKQEEYTYASLILSQFATILLRHYRPSWLFKT